MERRVWETTPGETVTWRTPEGNVESIVSTTRVVELNEGYEMLLIGDRNTPTPLSSEEIANLFK